MTDEEQKEEKEEGGRSRRVKSENHSQRFGKNRKLKNDIFLKNHKQLTHQISNKSVTLLSDLKSAQFFTWDKSGPFCFIFP